MKFRTEVEIPQVPFLLNHENAMFLIGSCFTENIGLRLERYRFPALVNPYGILYNPISIETALLNIQKNKIPEEEQIIFHNNMWHSLLHHGSVSRSSKDELLEEILTRNEQAGTFLKEASVAFITPGSAYVYEHPESASVAANCHKIPQKSFNKNLLSYNTIISSLQRTVSILKELNPEISCVFTVSPVIHLRDGLIANNRSKSLLCSAVSSICEEIESAYYFPSYEIVNSELRDYRFYAEDMVHPSQKAILYIWERFTQTFFEEGTRQTCESIENLLSSIEHRPFNPESDDYKKHKQRTLEKIEAFEKTHPGIYFDQEKILLKQDL